MKGIKIGESRIMEKKKSAILGATGVAGQQFLEALIGHPWFEISGLYASERSEGKPYGVAATWHSPNPLPGNVASLMVKNIENVVEELDQYDIVFSALPSDVAETIEGRMCGKKTRHQHRIRFSL